MKKELRYDKPANLISILPDIDEVYMKISLNYSIEIDGFPLTTIKGYRKVTKNILKDVLISVPKNSYVAYRINKYILCIEG
jgi:hypothetical protein